MRGSIGLIADTIRDFERLKKINRLLLDAFSSPKYRNSATIETRSLEKGKTLSRVFCNV